MRLNAIIHDIASKCPDGGDMVIDAFYYASEKHRGQRRKSGEPYIVHPVRVAQIIANEFHIMDTFLLCAALLHDVVEDVEDVALEDIERQFGKTVAELVDGCTKDLFHFKDQVYVKVLLSASKYLGVLVIKMADRLHNLRTLHYLAQPKRRRIAQETIDIYVPLAVILNMYNVKREFYNLTLTELYPRKSRRILNHVKKVGESPEIVEIRNRLVRAFENFPARVEVRSRVKGLGSYYDHNTMTLDIGNAENYVDFTVVIYDNDPMLCYQALGVVNSAFVPQRSTIRDFIANPKQNGYQSIHVRIKYDTGETSKPQRGEQNRNQDEDEKQSNFLVKIRTQKMDEWAMYGILRRWYEDKRFFREEHNDEIARFLQDLAKYSNPGERRKVLKSSQLEEIAVYTPKGDQYFFPKGSIVLDFAYKIHSQLGDCCSGALIGNRKLLPTDPLENEATIKVLTHATSVMIDPEAEALCKTAKAKIGVSKLLQKQRKRYALNYGREIFDQILDFLDIRTVDMSPDVMKKMFEQLGFDNEKSLLEHLGQDLISPKELIKVIRDAIPDGNRIKLDKLKLEGQHCPVFKISIGQLDRVVHKFAQCCSPYPGQEGCIGVLSERGVTIHRPYCNNPMERHNLPADRLVKINWLSDNPWDTPLVFRTIIKDVRPGQFLLDWQHSREFEILHIEQRKDKHGRVSTLLSVTLNSLEEAKEFFKKLNQLYPKVTIEQYKSKLRLMDCN
ncbi:MAG: bifunctional (p)ppGpp synthetase/guanosine-3',5'-bis(diphosphate) 3'-pyrophosphohydrolase [Deltaproteobacteria bacterium]|nr:bifunctional (p)ppGpp synthetase/guanosine-3',5'-bis(diphosphate) 3'-pyrophosphohydrolase [Deltaproteobacteria bacterium]MBW2068847.1 bifunctional (p)ppGpp synthetase/guanosine-3',5'-bis(diphosphate) 3'-pyrophosphohydrolase [Deltaproteobacteria bacterium]